MIYKIYYIVVTILLLNACDTLNHDNMQFEKKIGEYIFQNASDRSSAYIENQKIITFKNHTFLLILNYENNEYKLYIVHFVNNKIQTTKYIDDVPDNHGGGSIFLNQDNKICIIYGGHLEKLKYRCSVKSLDIHHFGDSKFLDINKKNIYQTYPSVVSDENLIYLVYREENIEKNTRNPKIVFMELDKNWNVIHKDYIYTSDSYYSNFTASITKELNRINILFMTYGVKKNKTTKFNKGIFLARSIDSGLSFNILPIKINNLNHNYYNSNLIQCNHKLYFTISDYLNNNSDISLYAVDQNDTILSYNLEFSKTIQNLKEQDFLRNVRASISCDSANELYLLAPFQSALEEQNWNAVSNRIFYFKIDPLTHKISTIFKESHRSWLANIDKNPEGIPSIIYNYPDRNETVYKYFK